MWHSEPYHRLFEDFWSLEIALEVVVAIEERVVQLQHFERQESRQNENYLRSLRIQVLPVLVLTVSLSYVKYEVKSKGYVYHYVSEE